MEKTCVEEVRYLAGTAEYEDRPKKRKRDFSRKRNMPFKKLMWFTLSLVKESAQNALERFFPEDERSGTHEASRHSAWRGKK
ncbi:MAG: hypothetical protein LBG27_08055 [Spirochaetaceae bacterium]|jgi:hypothetical protein|nr:hypothetical protein [Spirochaetaceae bacterium]